MTNTDSLKLPLKHQKDYKSFLADEVLALCWFVTLHAVGSSVFMPVMDAHKSDVQSKQVCGKADSSVLGISNFQ